MESQNKFSIINGVVHKFGEPSICPFKNSFVLPGTMGGMEIKAQFCLVNCPMCNVYKGALSEEHQNNGVSQHFIQITCGSMVVAEYIEEPTNESPKKLSIAQ